MSRFSRVLRWVLSLMVLAPVVPTSGNLQACAQTKTIACDLEKFMDPRTLGSLAEAKDVKALREVWQRKPTHDLAERIIYYTRGYKLSPDEATGLELLRTIPNSLIELLYFYAIQDVDSWEKTPALQATYNDYFPNLAKLAASHPASIRQILLMNCIADGAIREDTEDLVAMIKGLNSAEYKKAVQGLDPDSRRCYSDE